jgi:Effector-associated domain 4/NB-ARC domain
MPSKHRFNTSDTVKTRIIQIVSDLVKQGNQIDIDKSIAKWRESDRNRTKLMVRCKTQEFIQLCYPNTDSSRTGSLIYNDMWVLKEWLGILEDHRIETKGVKHLHFTLTLWSKQPRSNVENLEQLWQELKQNRQQISSNRITALQHNLPRGNYSSFVGYESQQQELLGLLNDRNYSKLITIEGIAGSGKTSLVLEVINRYCQSDRGNFLAIVFTSAQPSYCLAQGIIDRVQVERNLTDILSQILKVLNTVDVIPNQFNELLATTRQALAAQSTLLVIDNIETTEDRYNLFAFLHELPPTVTTIVTSRYKLGFGQIVSLTGLDRTNSIKLIKQITTQKNLTITPSQIESIWQITSGIPLAINYIISYAYLLGSITALNLDRIRLQTGDLANYCFGDLMQKIRGEFTHRILMALSLFSHPASQSAAVFIADLQNYPLQALAALKELNFLNLILSPEAESYGMHSLTREYSRQELSQDRDYESKYLNRWVSYYLDYTQPYSQLNWQEWQNYHALDLEWLNLRDVVEYCIAEQRLGDFERLWHNLHGYTLICGKWTERLAWLEWWIQIEDRDDRLAIALYHQSQTLAHINEVDPNGEAIALAHQSWNYSNKLDPIVYTDLRFEIALHIAALYIRQQQSSPVNFSHAEEWLDLAKATIATGAPQAVAWYQSQILYYQAEIELRSGNNPKAKELYLQTYKLAQEIGFKRLSAYAKSRTAVITFQAQELEETFAMFQELLQIAEINQDRRSLSFARYYLALVERERGNRNAAKTWAQLAVESFERLLMKQEANNAIALLREVS